MEHPNISKAVDGLLVVFSWAFSLLAINVSHIPVVLSTIVTLMAGYKYVLEIKKLRNGKHDN